MDIATMMDYTPDITAYCNDVQVKVSTSAVYVNAKGYITRKHTRHLTATISNRFIIKELLDHPCQEVVIDGKRVYYRELNCDIDGQVAELKFDIIEETP